MDRYTARRRAYTSARTLLRQKHPKEHRKIYLQLQEEYISSTENPDKKHIYGFHHVAIAKLQRMYPDEFNALKRMRYNVLCKEHNIKKALPKVVSDYKDININSPRKLHNVACTILRGRRPEEHRAIYDSLKKSMDPELKGYDRTLWHVKHYNKAMYALSKKHPKEYRRIIFALLAQAKQERS